MVKKKKQKEGGGGPEQQISDFIFKDFKLKDVYEDRVTPDQSVTVPLSLLLIFPKS